MAANTRWSAVQRLSRPSPPSWCEAVESYPNLGARMPAPFDLLVHQGRQGFVVSTIVRRLGVHEYLVLPKYVEGEGPWHFAGRGLRRVLRSYAPSDVVKAVEQSVHARSAPGLSLEYSPLFGVEVPEATLRPGVIVCRGVRAVEALTARDEVISSKVSTLLLELLTTLEVRFRVTGSLLMGGVHEGSDLDLVVGGLNEVYHAWERVNVLLARGRLTRPPREALEVKISLEASARNLPVELVKTLITPWQRFCLGGLEASLTLSADELRGNVERRIFVLKPSLETVRLLCRVEPLSYGLLDYPGLVEAVCGASKGFLLTVFDGLFVPRLFEGGLFEVRAVEGLVCWSSCDCEKALFVGVREAKTYVKPA